MKVALYARVSTDKQTTDNQMIRLREWADRMEWEVYKEYIDIRSGKDTRRPALQEMLNDAKHKEFDCVVAVKLDRIARSVIDLKKVMEDLQSWSIGVKMLDQDIDTTTASGRFMITIIGAVAEFEREMIVERTNDGLNRARKQGKKLGRKTRELSPYQIEKAKAIIAENPNISQRQLAEQFEGIARPQLIKQLKALGILQSGTERGSTPLYILNPKNENGTETSDCEPLGTNDLDNGEEIA